MINFILISLVIYILIFSILSNLSVHNVVKILIAGYVGGSYLNIADNGKMVKWLNIQLTDDIIYASLGIMIIYIITTFFVFREPYENQ